MIHQHKHTQSKIGKLFALVGFVEPLLCLRRGRTEGAWRGCQRGAAAASPVGSFILNIASPSTSGYW